jgi:hypothetical protein
MGDTSLRHPSSYGLSDRLGYSWEAEWACGSGSSAPTRWPERWAQLEAGRPPGVCSGQRPSGQRRHLTAFCEHSGHCRDIGSREPSGFWSVVGAVTDGDQLPQACERQHERVPPQRTARAPSQCLWRRRCYRRSMPPTVAIRDCPHKWLRIECFRHLSRRARPRGSGRSLLPHWYRRPILGGALTRGATTADERRADR